MTEELEEFNDKWLRAVTEGAIAPPSVRNLTWPPQDEGTPASRLRGPLRRRLAPTFSMATLFAGTATVLAASLVAISLWRNSTPAPPNSGNHPVVSQRATPLSGQPSTTASSSHSSPTPAPVPGGASNSGGRSAATSAPLSTINCFPKPSSCGYPDSTNTGVPAGITLTPVAQASLPSGATWDPTESTLTITKNETTISDISIGPNGSIWVEANNVNIRDVAVSSSGYFDIVIRPGFGGTVIEDSTLSGQDGGSNSTSYAIQDEGSGGTQMFRLNMYNCWACVLSDGLVQDSYIHDLAANPSAADISGSGNGQLQVVHDTLLNQYSTEYVVFCPNQNCTINNNLLAGGGYTIEGGTGSGPGGNSGSNIVITNNRFSTAYFPACGSTGDVVHFDLTVSGNAWSGNVWDSSNAALPYT